MPLPAADASDVSLLSSNTRVLVHEHHVLELARVEGDTVKYRVTLLSAINQLFRDRSINFPRTQWEFDNIPDAETFARNNALLIYNQFKALDDVASIIGGL